MKTSPLTEAPILDALPDAILVTDREGRYVHANPAALELTGYSLEELQGLSITDVVAADAPWTQEQFERFLEAGSWQGRFDLRRRDGSVVSVESIAKPMETTGGVVYIASNRVLPRGSWTSDVPAIQQAVTSMLAEAESVDEVAPVLEVIARDLGWDVAELWVVREEELHLVGVWSTPDLALSDFVEQTRQKRFARGEGLPGTVWETGLPAWISEGFDDPKFLLGRDVSAAGGLNSAFGLPLRSGDEVVGVLAAISRRPREEEPDLPIILEPVTGQLAQFVHRTIAMDALRQSRDQLAAILGGVGDGITVQDPNGRLLYANEGAARAIGFDTVEELLTADVTELMQRFKIFHEDGSPMDLDELPGRRALLGERNAKEIVRFRIVATGEERWSLVTASPVLDGSGNVVFAINIFQDITERRRFEAGQRFLGEASALLASSLQYEDTLASVSRLAVSGLADWCVALISEDDGLRRLEVAHADPQLEPLVEEMQRKYPMDQSRSRAIFEVAETGQSLLIPEITEELLKESAIDDEHLADLRRLGFRSAIAVPMRTYSRILGVIVMISSTLGRRFDEFDLALAEELGRRAGIAIDHARIYREREHVATTLQRSLLPPALPSIPGFDLAARYRPAKEEVGGDFYDVFPLAEGCWGLMVGDVCGKGAEAASLTALARYTVRAAAIEHPAPSEALSVLNEALLQHDLEGRFCTLAVVRLKPVDGSWVAQVASGGHPLPTLMRADGTIEQVGTPGTLLGVIDDPHVIDGEVEIGVGDSLVLYTDGVIDEFRMSGSDLEETLTACVGLGATEIATRVEDLALGDRETPRDDVALLVARRLV